MLKGFSDTEEASQKRFNAVKFTLNSLNRLELNIKSTLDLVTRICLDLESFSNEQIVRLVEDCSASIRHAESKTVYWKDLLPQLFNIILTQKVPVNVEGITMSGTEYRSAIIKNLLVSNWRLEILTPLAAMFK